MLNGSGRSVTVKIPQPVRARPLFTTGFEGAIPHIQRRHAEAESDASRERYAGYMREVPCPVCRGARLKPVSLAVTIGERSIADVSALPIGEAMVALRALALDERDAAIGARVLKEIDERLQFLVDVGLRLPVPGPPGRHAGGGEAQRIRLATQIGSGLVGVLYVLDEPSIGLHQRDNRRLIETLVRLRDLGNTLIVVEHDEDTIRAADWVVDIGPGAGEHGGEVVVSGPVRGCWPTSTRSRAPSSRAARQIEFRPRGGRRSRAGSCGWWELGSTTWTASMPPSRWAASWPSPGSAAAASQRWSTTCCIGCWPAEAQRS